MSPGELYPLVRPVHIGSVVLSGSLFALRGIAVQLGSPLGNHASLRMASYVIDSVLLGAAVTLLLVLHLDPWRTPWVAAKIGLLPVYIVLGSLALKRGRTPGVRRVAFFAALLLFAFIVSIAVRHDPAGFLGAGSRSSRHSDARNVSPQVRGSAGRPTIRPVPPGAADSRS